MSTNAIDLNSVVTLVIQHKVRGESLPEYEAWLRRTVKAAQRWPGHLGVNVIRPDGCDSLFTTVVRFARADQLQAWIDSTERAALIGEVQALLEEGDHPLIQNDAEFWFTPRQAPPSPRWKQACVTFLVILPLSLLVPLLWRPLFRLQPWLGGYLASNVVITASIVLLVVYLFMPAATRLFANWLSAGGTQ
ncbi:antibiotic biosynthesis monooxygenase [Pseudomonas sp. PSE14]|uniref:antibiotic biosynthesis monooxygenase n=1 Tax=Pseudomonas sp. PSE14 TaxID=3016341 RepID=UPI0023D84B64|nr:antibiotic biosynthesis monooxygenase [Pseudomonas sp. PSE14]WEJ74851.1 antibiotic biosynthesis monooxygenase [Pseudomonas sp. PSE14]